VHTADAPELGVRVDEAAAALRAAPTAEHFAGGLCRAAGDLLALDLVHLVRWDPDGTETMAHWTRPRSGLRRLPDASLPLLVTRARGAGGARLRGADLPVEARGALGALVVPIASERALVGAVVGLSKGPRPPGGDDLAALRRLVGDVVSSAHMAHALRADELRGPVDDRRLVPARDGSSARLAEHMQLLQSLSAALARARSEAEVGQAVVSELRTLIDYHSCRFYVLSTDGRRLLPIAYRGFGLQYESDRYEDLVCEVGHGIAGTAFEQGAPLLIHNALDVPYAESVPGTDDIDESMVVAPLRSESGTLGVIVLTKEGAGEFDGDDMRLLEVIAAQAAVACENARLYAQLHESAEVSEALLDLGGALAMQTTVEGIANMLALAADRLVESAAISVWLRRGDVLEPAATVGYSPAEEARLSLVRIDVTTWPLAHLLRSRRVVVGTPDEAAPIANALHELQPGTTFAFVAVGERAANRAVIAVQRGPRRGAPTPRDERMLLGIVDQALPAIGNRALFEELEQSFLATVEALANALEMKDRYTNDHAQALIGLTVGVARRLGVSDDELRDMSFAAALHDIGKIGIPAEILNKPGRLSEEEWAVMKRHPELGGRIIEPVTALAGARRIVVACHEHWDGSGYPLGLVGTETPLGARVILACDAFHAMTSDRVYRPAMSELEAVQELHRCAGAQFDPVVVAALVEVVAEGGWQHHGHLVASTA
jgi:HD-GYP domain-containing protein (c-di-GMP phosphodiesterase class II)